MSEDCGGDDDGGDSEEYASESEGIVNWEPERSCGGEGEWSGREAIAVYRDNERVWTGRYFEPGKVSMASVVVTTMHLRRTQGRSLNRSEEMRKLEVVNQLQEFGSLGSSR